MEKSTQLVSILNPNFLDIKLSNICNCLRETVLSFICVLLNQELDLYGQGLVEEVVNNSKNKRDLT